MFDENYHNNNIQNEFMTREKNGNFNNINNNMSLYPNPFANNPGVNNVINDEEASKIFQSMNNKKDNNL